jgi:hypothetical protein
MGSYVDRRGLALAARALGLAAAVAAITACGASRREPAAPAATAGRMDDPDRLYVSVSVGRSHGGSLRDGARAGLARIPFVVVHPAGKGGDVELQLAAHRLDAVGRETVCGIKILALRLPQRDLFGMAEGSARAGGTDQRARHDCLAQLGQSLIGGKVRVMLHRRLAEKR